MASRIYEAPRYITATERVARTDRRSAQLPGPAPVNPAQQPKGHDYGTGQEKKKEQTGF